MRIQSKQIPILILILISVLLIILVSCEIIILPFLYFINIFVNNNKQGRGVVSNPLVLLKEKFKSLFHNDKEFLYSILSKYDPKNRLKNSDIYIQEYIENILKNNKINENIHDNINEKIHDKFFLLKLVQLQNKRAISISNFQDLVKSIYHNYINEQPSIFNTQENDTMEQDNNYESKIEINNYESKIQIDKISENIKRYFKNMSPYIINQFPDEIIEQFPKEIIDKLKVKNAESEVKDEKELYSLLLKSYDPKEQLKDSNIYIKKYIKNILTKKYPFENDGYLLLIFVQIQTKTELKTFNNLLRELVEELDKELLEKPDEELLEELESDNKLQRESDNKLLVKQLVEQYNDPNKSPDNLESFIDLTKISPTMEEYVRTMSIDLINKFPPNIQKDIVALKKSTCILTKESFSKKDSDKNKDGCPVFSILDQKLSIDDKTFKYNKLFVHPDKNPGCPLFATDVFQKYKDICNPKSDNK